MNANLHNSATHEAFNDDIPAQHALDHVRVPPGLSHAMRDDYETLSPGDDRGPLGPALAFSAIMILGIVVTIILSVFGVWQ